ncbi:transposase, partial [Burkholderia ubonensis]|uniref:transposase n=1 Tax=Burkholderia ubonensis TaxID=101571 RepID=UPI0018E01D85
MTDDFFRSRLDSMIDLRHPLAVLATRMPWAQLEATMAPLCERWAENVYFQYFCGEEYFQPQLPCDPTNLGRFRQVLGEAGVEELLATTIAAAANMKLVEP